jgi:hypothetical protein
VPPLIETATAWAARERIFRGIIKLKSTHGTANPEFNCTALSVLAFPLKDNPDAKNSQKKHT